MLTRRAFLTQSAGLIVAAPALHLRRQQRPDIIIRGGAIFDGISSASAEGDVVIAGERITIVGGRSTLTGATEIDARGLAVAPGFIDIHSHGDGSINSDRRSESIIRQGITTIVVGQDGSSRALVNGSFRQLLASFDAASSVNVASMIGLGSIRSAVVGGSARAATPDEIRRMVTMVETAIQGHACGASSGLEYTPGAFATANELAAVCKPLGAAGLPYATHMRNEDDRLLDSIDESIAVARGAGCPLHISHLKTQGPRNWNKLDTVFSKIAAARREGMDVTFDRYPYIAYSTSLSNLFPLWSREGGTSALQERLRDAGNFERIRAETLAKVEMIGGWDNVQITGGVSNPELRNLVGARLGTFARSINQDPFQLTRLLLTNGNPGMVGFAMSEENLDRILAHPLAMVCSDGGGFAIEGPARTGSPHPRGLGTFPRVLGRYVRERKALTLHDAIRKMTSAPAARLKLRDRGRLEPGMAADVVVFNPSTVIDKATYESPFQYPEGINVVIVNGRIALRDGTRQGTPNGRGVGPG